MTRQNLPDGLQENFNIKQWTPMLNVPNVMIHTSLHLLHRLSLPSATIYLSPTCKTWSYLMLNHISWNLLLELLYELRSFRAWSN